MRKKTFHPGERVRLTGKFLRSTGQYAGGEGHKIFTVVSHPGCRMCGTGDFVAVDEPPAGIDDGMYDDLSPEERAKLRRHINAANLVRARDPDYS